jgi:hypothetical protein
MIMIPNYTVHGDDGNSFDATATKLKKTVVFVGRYWPSKINLHEADLLSQRWNTCPDHLTKPNKILGQAKPHAQLNKPCQHGTLDRYPHAEA